MDKEGHYDDKEGEDADEPKSRQQGIVGALVAREVYGAVEPWRALTAKKSRVSGRAFLSGGTHSTCLAGLRVETLTKFHIIIAKEPGEAKEFNRVVFFLEQSLLSLQRAQAAPKSPTGDP